MTTRSTTAGAVSTETVDDELAGPGSADASAIDLDHEEVDPDDGPRLLTEWELLAAPEDLSFPKAVAS